MSMAVDRQKTQELVNAISDVIVEVLEGNPTSSSEVVSALFTVLDRILGGIRKQPPSVEKIHNIQLINRNLMELMIEESTH